MMSRGGEDEEFDDGIAQGDERRVTRSAAKRVRLSARGDGRVGAGKVMSDGDGEREREQKRNEDGDEGEVGDWGEDGDEDEDIISGSGEDESSTSLPPPSPPPSALASSSVTPSTARQYSRLLTPLAIVVGLCRGLTSNEAARRLRCNTLRPHPCLAELRATIACLAVLGINMRRRDCCALLTANARMLCDPRARAVLRLPLRPASINDRVRRSSTNIRRRGLTVKRASLASYWHKLRRCLVGMGHQQLREDVDWRAELGLFIKDLRIARDEPLVDLRGVCDTPAVIAGGGDEEGDDAGTAEDVDGARSHVQTRPDPIPRFSPPPAPSAASAAPPALRVPLQSGGSNATTATTAAPAALTLDESIAALEDPAAAVRAAKVFRCPTCDLDCKTYTQLLFHWVCATCSRKTVAATTAATATATTPTTRVWCAFCRCFLVMQNANDPAASGANTSSPSLLRHKRECAYSWGLRSGYHEAILLDTSLRRKSDKQRAKRGTGVFPDAPYSEYYRPCAVTVPNFFALKAGLDDKAPATSSPPSSSRMVTWYFCPECSGNNSNANDKSALAPTIKKAFAVFRTPTALAQHYQEHIVRGGGRLGEKRLPLNQSYDAADPWRCTYPACQFTATTLVQRVDHLSKEHMVPLLVDRRGQAVKQAVVGGGECGGEATLHWWRADIAEREPQSVDLFLTRGKTDMQRGRRAIKERERESGRGEEAGQDDDG